MALVYRVEHGGRVYLNPILKVQKGGSVAVRLANDIGEDTIVHWHGLHVDWRNDGHPIHAVPSGQAYEYSFAVQDRSATYWYHPHPHTLTGRQAYRGLAGFFLVEDEDERRLREQLDLQFGVTDLPLLIQDKRFDERGQLIYLSGDPMEQFSGFFGDVMAVNLSVNPSLDVSTRLYRFRLLNGSNARSYRLAFTRGNDSLPFHLIGTDGGLLAQAASVKELFLSPAERADVLLDLRDLGAGDTVFLRSVTFDPMHNEMGGMGGMGGMGHGGMQQGDGTTSGVGTSRLDDGEAFYLLRLSIRERVAYDRTVPTTLASVDPIDVRGAGSRTFELSQGMMMQWLINGRSFEMDSALFSVRKGATEVWDIRNADASMPHPMHLHGFQFQVVERRGSPSQLRGLTVDGKGRLPTDLGWKDTVLVWPGETVSVAASFAHGFEGEQTYQLHCHNLEHEDMGMMVNYRVT